MAFSIQTQAELISHPRLGEFYWDIFRPKTLKRLITSQYDSGYQLQTITNRVQMLERFLWILSGESYYDEDLEDPVVDDDDASAIRARLPSAQWFELNKDTLVKACDVYALSFSELKKQSKKSTRSRNNKKSLEEQNKWVDIPDIVAAATKELKTVLKLSEVTGMTIISIIRVNLAVLDENFVRIRGAMLVCLSTFRVPLRPQNWRLLVLDKEMASSLDERKVLTDYNRKHYSDKSELVTGYLIRPKPNKDKKDKSKLPRFYKLKFIDYKVVSYVFLFFMRFLMVV